MEKEINEILGMLYDIYNQVMVLNDSLQLSARDNKDNDYQHSFSEIILKNLADACSKTSKAWLWTLCFTIRKKYSTLIRVCYSVVLHAIWHK